MSIIAEVVVYNIESALNAQRGGADRVELCDNPGGGGTTPSFGTFKALQPLLSIPVFIMIRPRGGDFYYSELEFEAMKHDICQFKKMGADGIVFGILNKDGTIDKKRCKKLIQLAQPLPATFHRAFDMTRDPNVALQDCIEVGFNRILTSGQKPTAPEGLSLIAELAQKAGNDITIMPGAGINEKTVSSILCQAPVNEIHFSAKTKRPSEMEFLNSDILGMGSAKGQEYDLQTVSSKQIQEIRKRGEKAISERQQNGDSYLPNT